MSNLSQACGALFVFFCQILMDIENYPPINHPPVTQMLQLLRTLLEKPSLCASIHNADFEGCRCTDREPRIPSHVPALPFDQLSAVIERTGVSQFLANEWKDKIQSGHPEAIVAVLVHLLPNLERLFLSENWTDSTECLRAMLQAALCDKPQHREKTDLPTFASLKYVSLAITLNEARLFESRNTADALVLSYLPSIETLSVSIDNPTVISWPSFSPPSPITLKSLEIFRLGESCLAPILSVTNNLKKLRYNRLYRSDIDAEVSTEVVMLDIMANTFLDVKDSPEELEITEERALAPSRVRNESNKSRKL